MQVETGLASYQDKAERYVTAFRLKSEKHWILKGFMKMEFQMYAEMYWTIVVCANNDNKQSIFEVNFLRNIFNIHLVNIHNISVAEN